MISDPVETDQDWSQRELYWRSRLSRLRFDAEPIPVQVERYRRVTLALTIVASVVALMFLMIFSAFRRPDIAFLIILFGFAPIVGLAWLDFRRLSVRANAYLSEWKKAKGIV